MLMRARNHSPWLRGTDHPHYRRVRHFRGLLLALLILPSGGAARTAESAPPRLNLSTSDPQSDLLTWEDVPEEYYVEELPGLDGPRVWMPVMDLGQATAGIRRLVLPRHGTVRFFQLRRDPDLTELMLNHAMSLAADLPLQTSAADVYPDVPFLDRFNPIRWSPLVGVPRTLDGGFVLVPGLWEVELESFCLKTGTPTPAEGDGYVPALMRGPRADILAKIIRELSLDPGIEQESAQILLWAIVLRTPLGTLPSALQSLAAQLLSREELDRLEVASALKARQSEAYTRRFVLALHQSFENLSPGIRDLLKWDDLVEDALSRAEELSYEQIQDLAFAATAPPVPPEPGREVVYGRWAWLPAADAPPGGFLIRYLVGFYTETLVQVCVPETITVETDPLGRITRIADLAGMEIRTTYDDTVPALTIAGEPDARGHAFANVQVSGPPDPEDPRRLLTASYAGAGWALAGPLTGGGTTQNEGRFQDAVARYAWALEQKTELERLDRELSRVHSGRPAGPSASAARLLNLANYCEGLRIAFADLPEDDPTRPQFTEQLGLAYRAWIAEFAAFARGETGAHTPALAGNESRPQPDILDRTIFRLFDWMFSTRQYQAKPANSGRQNIGLAGRVTNALKNWWNQNFAGHKKHSTLVKTSLKATGLPPFLGIPLAVIEKHLSTVTELIYYSGDVIRDAGTEPPKPFKPGGRALAAGGGTPIVRNDYTVPTREQLWNPGPLEAGPGISARRLTALQRLDDRLLELAAHLHATVIAIQRQLGARNAGDSQWYMRQGGYAVHHARRAGVLMLDTADAIEDVTAVLVDEGVEDPWLTREDLDAVLERLRTEGYTSEERQILRQLGMSDDEIAACLAASVNEVIEPDGVSAWQSVRDFAGALRELGFALMQFPVAFPMQGN